MSRPYRPLTITEIHPTLLGGATMSRPFGSYEQFFVIYALVIFPDTLARATPARDPLPRITPMTHRKFAVTMKLPLCIFPHLQRDEQTADPRALPYGTPRDVLMQTGLA